MIADNHFCHELTEGFRFQALQQRVQTQAEPVFQSQRLAVDLGQLNLKAVDRRKALNLHQLRFEPAISFAHQAKIGLDEEWMLGLVGNVEVGRNSFVASLAVILVGGKLRIEFASVANHLVEQVAGQKHGRLQAAKTNLCACGGP